MEKTLIEDIAVLSIIGAGLSNADNSVSNTDLQANRETALNYFMGNLPAPAEEGRSSVVSTDVADAIQWILPQMIRSLIGKGSPIKFDALSEQDESQSKLETQLVHEVFSSDNNGYLNLLSFCNDALLMKNGIFKVYWEEAEDIREDSYQGLVREQLQTLTSNPNVEIVSLTEPQPDMFDVMISTKTMTGSVQIDVIPPEEFRINEGHNSLDLKTAQFTSHITLKTRSELLELGYDPEVIENASQGVTDIDDREYRFTAQGEDIINQGYNYSNDTSQDLIEVAESYAYIDINETGIAQLVKVVTIGGESPTDLLEMEQVEHNPFVSSAAIVMPHKFWGLSIFDRLQQVQDQKTSLWRNILDNLYLQNNREKEVVEGKVNIDDLLISRPGGIKRVKELGSIRELQVQPLGQEAPQMMDYLDRVRTGRAGVSPESAGVPSAVAGDTAHGIERTMSASEELVGLMIRNVAETGLRAVYSLIRELLIENKSEAMNFKSNGEWGQSEPSTWPKRTRVSVSVGSGAGEDMRKTAALRELIGYQVQAIQTSEQTLTNQDKIFNSMEEFCSLNDMGVADQYFLNPDTPEGKQAKEVLQQNAQQASQKNEEMQKAALHAQQTLAEAEATKAEAEQMKGQASLQSQQVKLEVEKSNIQSGKTKQLSDDVIAGLKLELQAREDLLTKTQSESKAAFDLIKLELDEKFRREELETSNVIKLTELELKYEEDTVAGMN